MRRALRCLSGKDKKTKKQAEVKCMIGLCRENAP